MQREERRPSILGSDPWLLAASVALCLIGVVMIYSSTHNMALDRYNDAYYHLKKHLFTLGLGCIALFVASRTPIELLRRFTFPLLFFVIALLFLLFVPGFGVKAGGAIRWLKLGGIRVGQPSELAKLAVVLYLAHSLERKSNQIESFFRGYLPHLLVVGFIVGLLMLQPDFGTSMMILSMTGAVLFVGGIPIRYLAGSAMLALPPIYLMLIWSPYRWKRIISFWDPMAKENIQAGAYQLVQSLKAFASGGLTGLGLGNGQQKLGYLPEAHTDFIFAVVGEELGLVGVLVVIGLILLVVYRGFRIALRCSSPFGRYLAFGVSSLIGLQTLINMGVVMGSLPTKGMPLPFISFARSSLIVVLASIGLLLQIESRSKAAAYAASRAARENKASKKPKKTKKRRKSATSTTPDASLA